MPARAGASGAVPGPAARQSKDNWGRAVLAPSHASWLNMAELDASALERQCLDRRIGDTTNLRREVASWVRARNEAGATVHWRFTS